MRYCGRVDGHRAGFGRWVGFLSVGLIAVRYGLLLRQVLGRITLRGAAVSRIEDRGFRRPLLMVVVGDVRWFVGERKDRRYVPSEVLAATKIFEGTYY